MKHSPCDMMRSDKRIVALLKIINDLLDSLIELDQWAQSQQFSEYPAGTFEVVQNAIQKAIGAK